jgi:hypothetical protein
MRTYLASLCSSADYAVTITDKVTRVRCYGETWTEKYRDSVICKIVDDGENYDIRFPGKTINLDASDLYALYLALDRIHLKENPVWYRMLPKKD